MCGNGAGLCIALQTIKAHGFGLNSIWDVSWAPSTASNGSNGNHHGSSDGSLKVIRPINGSSISSNGAPSGGNGTTHSSERVGTSAGIGSTDRQQAEVSAAPHSSDAADGDNSSAVPAPAQEGCEFTTWKFRSNGVAKRTIDYVWYTGAQLAPISRWRMLSEAEIGPEGLPNTSYPSDHMAVTCQFGWMEQ